MYLNSIPTPPDKRMDQSSVYASAEAEQLSAWR
jgi:hypothetical protein